MSVLFCRCVLSLPLRPQAFPEWRAVMDGWGAALLGAATAVAGLAAVGLGLQPAALQVSGGGAVQCEECREGEAGMRLSRTRSHLTTR